MKANKCGAITMVWRSQTFLKKWIEHYGAAFGKENLFIVGHGNDDANRAIASECNYVEVPREFSIEFDVHRWNALSKLTEGFGSFYHMLLCCDVDEYIVVDPKVGTDLQSYLLASDPLVPLAPLGVEVIPNEEEFQDGQCDLDWDKPILEQLPRVFTNSEYCKPCIVGRPVEFTPGGHGLFRMDFRIDKNLVLFHLRYADSNIWQSQSEKLVLEVRASINEANTPEAHEKISTRWRATAAELKSLQLKVSAPFDDRDNFLDELFVRYSRHYSSTPEKSSVIILRSRARTFDIPARFRELL